MKRNAMWIAFVAGPLIGYGYFWFVYLFAEVSCSPAVDGVDRSALRVIIVAGAVAAAVTVATGGWFARRARAHVDSDASPAASDADARAPLEERRFAASTAMILAGIFLAFIAFVTAPVLGSSLC